ncbi:MAG: glycerate kinase [Clostridia bacterium]|nr:glycerate kinase [Clostridia bacterium]
MNIVAVIDSFKGSLTSMEAGTAVSEGIAKALPDSIVSVFPVADGGEGTVDALTDGGRGEKVCVTVTGPLSDPVEAEYGVLAESGCAVIEMAQAAGLPLVPEDKRDPMYTTTYGVGELILHALDRGCRRFIMGIGGSATNDGGAGMLSALGFEFLDCEGKPVPDGCAGLGKLSRVCADRADVRLRECTFRVACDVTNPLLGDNGCSAVFAPQKGASAEDIPVMDAYLKGYAELTQRDVNEGADACFPGAGAAGGLGFALKYYLNATLERGCPMIMRETGVEDSIAEADLVITGEGRLDAQSVMGKVPQSVAEIAKKHGVPVIALGGGIGDGAEGLNECGVDAYFPILHAPCTLADAMDKGTAINNLKRTSEQISRLISAMK